MKNTPNNRSYTLTEMMISGVLITILFGSALGAYVLTKRIYTDCVVSANLQRDIAVVARKITQGIHDGAGIFGLTEARSYSIPAPTEIDFVGIDNNMRRIFLSGAPPNQIIYRNSAGNNTVIYTAPAGSVLSLLFWPARFSSGAVIPGQESVAFYIGVLQNILGRTASASLQTNVNLRNLS